MNGDSILLSELATLDPLEDHPLKIMLSDDDQFKKLAEAFSGETFTPGKYFQMNGEIVLTTGGKLIRVDSLREASEAFINIEGQELASGFPLKRHIFYAAAIYANGIKEGGKWSDLKPVFVIVIYKNKSGTKLFEKATLVGDLIKTDDDSKQFTLIAINTAKWKDAETEELRAYLATFHHGIMTEDNKDNFADVDTAGTAFTNIQRAVRMACAHTKKQEYEEKGDDSMAALYATYLSTEEREAARNEGRRTTFDIVPEIMKLLRENVPASEIAKKCKVTTQEVEKLRVAL